MMDMNYVISLIIGTLFGFSELLNRYKSVTAIFTHLPSVIYLVLNGGISILTFHLMEIYGVRLGGIAENPTGRAVVAGLSAMLILRSSFLNFKVGDNNYDAGLAAIVQIFLSSADRAFDQSLSRSKLGSVTPIMQDIEFEPASKALPLICLMIMQNVPLEEQKRLGEEVEKLSSRTDVNSQTKSLCLGILLEKVVGLELLQQAVQSFKENSQQDQQGNEKTQLEELMKQFSKID